MTRSSDVSAGELYGTIPCLHNRPMSGNPERVSRVIESPCAGNSRRKYARGIPRV